MNKDFNSTLDETTDLIYGAILKLKASHPRQGQKAQAHFGKLLSEIEDAIKNYQENMRTIP